MPSRKRPVDAPRKAPRAETAAGGAAVEGRALAALALLLFLSGAGALVYQVLWIKQLSLVVGVDVHAVTAGVGAFFAGLALGGFVLGRWADRVARPLFFYALLEVGVAVLGVATTLGLAHAAPLFATLEAHGGLLAWVPLLALVGVAPFLMGGTLPVLVRALRLQAGQVGAGGGRLYAANTAGAIAGALLASFLLIPALGVQGSAYAAAAANLLAAVGAVALVRRAPSAVRIAAPARPASDARAAIILYALAGGIALGYEVVWSQAIVQFVSTRSFAFSVVLATYLTGLVAGAALFARWVDRVRDPWAAFGLLIAAAGLVALLEIAVLGRWVIILQTAVESATLAWTDSAFAGMCARFAVAAACIVFLPTLLLGAAFPAVLRLAVDPRHVGRDVGAVVAFSTIGGIAGTVLTGFVLVPQLGLVRTLAALAIAAAALGIVAVMRGEATNARAGWAVVGFGIAAVIAAVVTPSDRLASLLAGSRGGRLVSYEEGRGATVAVIEQSLGRTRFQRLYIQGVSNSGDAMPSLRYMRLQALLPLIIHGGEPRAALVIGLGTGITAGALLPYPGLERRVVAELLPAVRRAAPIFRGNFGAGSDPRLDIRLRDGRRELLRSADIYDLITLEPPPPSAAGVVNLYSSDFYRLAAARLGQGGLMAQWLPLATQNDADSRSLVRSFLDVFPHASLWTTEFHEMLLIGSQEPIVLDVPRIAQRFEQLGVAAALREVGVASPAALLATWVTGRSGLERYAGDAPPVTDDQPRIEYAPWVRQQEFARVLPRLLDLRSDPPLRGADEAFVAALAQERERLLAFYGAGLHAYKGERALWASQIQQVMKEDSLNPYYSWFSGGARQ
ncbi:fused MFS/spermidine synthase [Vineibacter terrae]|uniref:spermidine synthase n=1 Tax=Vineibacter terrae TaxID=2586908 RepID=UPI002E32FD83|nr:fused MFS/spermidine synthase [Vineibacter terrae]HEX2888441.1 fused MFS/spermidine synthase [Vineibacter terrae]